jgi:cysteine desulfuration protein SufE
VRGLIAVVMILFDGKTPAEILRADGKQIFSKLGLDQHLSPTRKNGLFSMLERIRTLAAARAVNAATTA